MTNTPNLGLHTWAPEDPVDVTEINENFTQLDTECADLAQNLSALTSAVGTGGHTCRIASGSYVGNGLAGQSHPNTLSFDFKPMVLMISDQNSANAHYIGVSFRGMGQGSVEYSFACVFTWGNNTVSWYNTDNSNYMQGNTSGHRYYYLVLGYDQ